MRTPLDPPVRSVAALNALLLGAHLAPRGAPHALDGVATVVVPRAAWDAAAPYARVMAERLARIYGRALRLEDVDAVLVERAPHRAVGG